MEDGVQPIWQVTPVHCLVNHCSVIATHWWTLLHTSSHFYILFNTFTHWCTFSPNGKTIHIDVLSTGLCSTLMDTFWCPLLNIGADWWLITCWYTLSGQPMLCHCWSLVNIGAHCYKLVHDILVRHIVWCAALLCHQLVTVAPEDWVSHHLPKETCTTPPALFLSYISFYIDHRFESYHPIVLVVGNR